MTGILDLIDSAVSDWETSDDAMRYRPKPAGTRIVTSGGTIQFGDGPVIPAINIELIMEPLVAHMSVAQEAFRLMGERMAEISIGLSGSFAQFAGLARALGMMPHERGRCAPPCACHPAPFPAARDYRRRTKHRNRRKT